MQLGGGINLAKISKKLLLQQGFAAFLLVIGSTAVYSLSEGVYIKLIDANYFNNMSWYVGYYFMVIVFAKLFLNPYLAKLEKKQYLQFLLVIFAVIQFSWSAGMINSLASGLLVYCTGIFLYALGGYIRTYSPFENVRSGAILVLIVAVYLLFYLSNYNIAMNKIQTYYRSGSTDMFIHSIARVADNGWIPIVIGVAVLELFRRLPVMYSNIVNYIGASTFMVYLLHDNNFFYSMWDTQDWITVLYYNPVGYVFKHILWTLATFGIGVLAYSGYLLAGRMLKRFKFLLLKTNV